MSATQTVYAVGPDSKLGLVVVGVQVETPAKSFVSSRAVVLRVGRRTDLSSFAVNGDQRMVTPSVHMV